MHKTLSVPPEQLRDELRAVQEQREEARSKKRFTRSRLDRHRADIELLANDGASWRDIAEWLKSYRQFEVHSTTVGRRLQAWRSEHQTNPQPPPPDNTPEANDTPTSTSPPVGPPHQWDLPTSGTPSEPG